MAAPKIVLHSTAGYRPTLDALVQSWIARGIKYVGVWGADASRVEDIIDELCIGNGAEPYEMLTAFHKHGEGLQQAVALANQVSDEFGTGVEIIEF